MESARRAAQHAEFTGFELDPERGFLPEVDPLRQLPRAFAAWEELAGEMPVLLLARRLHPALREMPELDPTGLHDGSELRRGMLLLSFLAHGWVWGGVEPEPELPPALARPWCKIAARLGRPPVLSYASYALDNWRRLDPAGPIELGNLAILQNFLGGADEDWFILVHVDIEARAGELLAALDRAQRAGPSQSEAQLGAELERAAQALEAMLASLKRIPEYCDPYIYYQRVRPFIHGWKNQPALPRGLRYSGVDPLGAPPRQLRGETGAQSSIVPCADAALGVLHSDDPLRQYLQEMREYMPPAHRGFLESLEARPSLRAPAVAAGGAVAAAYDRCLAALEEFRSVHLEYAARYIQRQSSSGPANPTDVGTGGTPFMSYLAKHREETRAQRLERGKR